jgi:hypothetical protein
LFERELIEEEGELIEEEGEGKVVKQQIEADEEITSHQRNELSQGIID